MIVPIADNQWLDIAHGIIITDTGQGAITLAPFSAPVTVTQPYAYIIRHRFGHQAPNAPAEPWDRMPQPQPTGG